MSHQLSNHNGAVFICNGCVQHFHSTDKFAQHKQECGGIVTRLPSEDKAILKFTHYERQLKVPFVVYADFECVLEDVVSANTTKTSMIQKHTPCAFSYNIKCSYNSSLNKFCIYTGEDASKKFLENLVRDCKFIYNNYLTVKKPMISLTPLEEVNFVTSENCHICDKTLGNDRVRDHCHLTGKYRGQRIHIEIFSIR